ncbi:hypothetical protein ACVIGB_000683 [Bradyrhizobium sp. USDA 4341]
MRKLFVAILAFSAPGSATALADDQTQVAEQLLASAFACPAPPTSYWEAGQEVKDIERSSFSGSTTGFVVTSHVRGLFDAQFMYEDRQEVPGPRESHQSSTTTANFADLSSSEIVADGTLPYRRTGKYLRLHCKSDRKCIRGRISRDIGPQDMRESSYVSDASLFLFCDDASRENAKAAFDALIATAKPVTPQLTSRTVKSAASGGYINLRQGPGLDRDVIVQIPAGETIAVDEAGCKPGSDGKTTYPFCPVTWNGKNGWASSSGFN